MDPVCWWRMGTESPVKDVRDAAELIVSTLHEIEAFLNRGT